MGRREGYAKPVAIASFSMDPELINWLNDYATKQTGAGSNTTKSWIVRKALLDFREKHDPQTTAGLPEGFWQCPACEQATANSDADAACWRCKEPKP